MCTAAVASCPAAAMPPVPMLRCGLLLICRTTTTETRLPAALTGTPWWWACLRSPGRCATSSALINGGAVAAIAKAARCLQLRKDAWSFHQWSDERAGASERGSWSGLWGVAGLTWICGGVTGHQAVFPEDPGQAVQHEGVARARSRNKFLVCGVGRKQSMSLLGQHVMRSWERCFDRCQHAAGGQRSCWANICHLASCFPLRCSRLSRAVRSVGAGREPS